MVKQHFELNAKMRHLFLDEPLGGNFSQGGILLKAHSGVFS